jgi:hypothetical protein
VDPSDDAFDDWRVVGYTRTSDEGVFRETITPGGSADYQARVEDEPSGCGPATSLEVPIRVRVSVSLQPVERVVSGSERARLRVVAAPLCDEGSRPVRFHIYQFRGGRFSNVASKRPKEGCMIVFRRRIRDTAVFQARLNRIDALHWHYLSGRSSQQVVGVRNK